MDAKDSLERLTALIDQAKHAYNPQDLQDLKDKFALYWSIATLHSGHNFERLSEFQSEFAAVSINTALRLAWVETAKRYRLKLPKGTIAGLFILGLGKLGGRDLNFSSDVDLIGFYNPDILPVPKTLGQAHICSKILQAMTQILNPRNAPDFIWRVDWRLRPESSGTGLAMSTQLAENFYFTRALPWHRLALMKAQIIGGDIETGQDFLKTITPFIWRQNLDFRALDDLADLKTRINLEHPSLRQERALPEPITQNISGFNVKLGRGGIREIEFIANAQQLIWGGKQYELRTTNTLQALQKLCDLGHIDAPDGQSLQEIYINFRQLENSIQMIGNEQTHIVPEAPEMIDIIQTFIQQHDWPQYSAQVFHWRKQVNAIFDRLFNREDDEQTPRALPINKLSAPSAAIAKSWANGFSNHGLNRNSLPAFHTLGKSLLNRVINSSSDSNSAFIHIDHFLQDLSRSEQYLHLLRRNPKLLDALITPLLHSSHMTELLRQSPHIIDVFLSAQSYVNSSSDIFTPETEFVLAETDYETRLERLRRFVNEHLFQYYHEFMRGADKLSDIQDRLTRLAETTIAAAIDIVRDDLNLTVLPIAVLGLGKMGTQRMAPLSDIDLIFIFDDNMDSELAAKIVRRLRTVLTTKLREGIAYDLDMRLRPSGRSGPPAVKLSAFKTHHMQRAKSWEHIALAHSRIVAGDKTLSRKVETIVQSILARPRDKMQFLTDAALMWTRISEQRIIDAPVNIINAKLRRGGLMQAEYLDACHIILEQPRSYQDTIDFYSEQQIWERLLGLTDTALADIPPRFETAILGNQSMRAYQATVKNHQSQTIKMMEHLFKNIPSPTNHIEKPIIWTDR